MPQSAIRAHFSGKSIYDAERKKIFNVWKNRWLFHIELTDFKYLPLSDKQLVQNYS